MSSETSPEQLERDAQLIRAMSSEQRAQALRSVDREARRLVAARIRSSYPDASEREVVIRHVAQIHGIEMARKLYGEVPADFAK